MEDNNYSEEFLKDMYSTLKEAGVPFNDEEDPLVLLRKSFYIIDKIQEVLPTITGRYTVEGMNDVSPLEGILNLSEMTEKLVVQVLEQQPFGMQLDPTLTLVQCLALVLKIYKDGKPLYFETLLGDVLWRLERKGLLKKTE